MQRDYVINFWSKAKLRCWSVESLRSLNIDVISKSFLSEVGLPFEVGLTLRFDPEEGEIPRLPKFEHFCRVGFDDFVPICIDESKMGRLVAVEDEEAGTERYVNASVEDFAEFLVYYEQYRTSVRGVSEDEALRLVAATEERMRSADPTAFKDPESWWPMIIEQMRDGML